MVGSSGTLVGHYLLDESSHVPKVWSSLTETWRQSATKTEPLDTVSSIPITWPLRKNIPERHPARTQKGDQNEFDI